MTVLTFAIMAFFGGARAEEIVGHFRPRPPEMVVADGKFSGPIKDILEQALAPLGLTISWQDVPFARSLKELKDGDPVIVPRYNRTAEREEFSLYLGPIAVQRRHIVFAVRQGDEQRIKSYADLASLTIGTKRGTSYFDQFDQDKTLHKEEVVDDLNLALPLRAGRRDAAIVLDQTAFESAAKEAGWSDYAWAAWRVDLTQANYYAIAKSGPLAAKGPAIDAALQAMAADGRVKAIYAKYGLDPEHVD
ncbi:MAG TPA: transporter substrate-binding domain-containing protein [Stellaceae bacterium]|nr:transporter substrate-binding domain-containing protein [Stellaceae bacterium]